jgi:Ser/Thr protein kinase RdoA (MazF antagonist)
MQTHPFETLKPELVIEAVESYGLLSDGRILPLNSYENRVYQVGVEDQAPVIVKFYRPERWDAKTIQEEHDFSLELLHDEIPVVAPLIHNQKTLGQHNGFYFAVYPRRGGRAPETDNADTLAWIGRFLGRIHAVGAKTKFKYRPTLSIKRYGYESFDYLMSHDCLPSHLTRDYRDTVEELLPQLSYQYEQCSEYSYIRLHGDCHIGNILWTEDHGPHFVDLDDCCNGPAIQDLWMLLSGTAEDMAYQLAQILKGYRSFHSFPLQQIRLIETLRTLRLIHYSAWLARRWTDPAFPLSFPWFASPHYWQEQIALLREQANRLDQDLSQLGMFD